MAFYVNTYETDRIYGGPEEGGWYYDVGTKINSRRLSTHRKAARIRNRIQKQLDKINQEEHRVSGDQSNATGNYLQVWVESYPAPDHFPYQQPHYE